MIRAPRLRCGSINNQPSLFQALLRLLECVGSVIGAQREPHYGTDTFKRFHLSERLHLTQNTNKTILQL